MDDPFDEKPEWALAWYATSEMRGRAILSALLECQGRRLLRQAQRQAPAEARMSGEVVANVMVVEALLAGRLLRRQRLVRKRHRWLTRIAGTCPARLGDGVL